MEKEEVEQELEKTVQKRKIEVTPQKEGKKPNKDKSPGQKQSIQKMEDDQVTHAIRSLKQALRKQGQSDDVISRAKRRLQQELRRQRFKGYSDSNIEATPQKDKSPGADEKTGFGPAKKTEVEQNTRIKISLEEKEEARRTFLEYVESKLRERRGRSRNVKPPSNLDRSRSLSKDRGQDRGDLG